MKLCSSCKCEKPFDDFAKLKSSKDGLQITCRKCQATYYVKNKSRLKPTRDAYRATSKEKEKIQKQEYYLKHKERILENNEKWRKNNLTNVNARQAKRRFAVKNACPSWADLEAIESFYAMAKWLELTVPGQKYHVDHIVPLINPLVCGLHVHHNLQILRAEDNRRKHNNFTV